MTRKIMNRVSVLLIFCICITGVFADAFKLSTDYRPVKLTIYWSGMDEEREHTSYEYNKKNQLIKASVYRGDDAAAWYDKFEYDKDNKLLKKSSYSKSVLTSSTNYTFINNKLYEEAELDKEGNYKRVEQYEYDDNGNLLSQSVRQVSYNDKNLTWYSLVLFTYNKDRKITNKFEYYNGTLQNKTDYEYQKNSLTMITPWLGDNRDVTGKTIKTFSYIDKGKNIGKIKELVNNAINLYNGEENIECCTTYTMIPEYDQAGNMSTLSFYNCEKELSGTAVILWEKGKTEMMLIKKIFERIHWFFTGC